MNRFIVTNNDKNYHDNDTNNDNDINNNDNNNHDAIGLLQEHFLFFPFSIAM